MAWVDLAFIRRCFQDPWVDAGHSHTTPLGVPGGGDPDGHLYRIWSYMRLRFQRSSSGRTHTCTGSGFSTLGWVFRRCVLPRLPYSRAVRRGSHLCTFRTAVSLVDRDVFFIRVSGLRGGASFRWPSECIHVCSLDGGYSLSQASWRLVLLLSRNGLCIPCIREGNIGT